MPTPMTPTALRPTDQDTTRTNGQSDDHLAALREHASDLKNNVREMGRLTRDVAREQVEVGKEKATRSAKALTDFARRKPYLAVLGTLGLGALIGWQLRR